MTDPNKDQSFTVEGGITLTSRINHDLCLCFLALFNNIMLVMKKIMNDRQIEALAKNLWNDFVKNYSPKSSKGFLIAGKRMTDLEKTFFFCERTFRSPDKRLGEWGDRLKKFTYECADTIFGETFAQALLGQIRVHRCRVCDANKENPRMEVEWFKMDTLEWDDINLVLTQVCLFVQTIKGHRQINQIDVNSASIAHLKMLPLVGDKLAAKIVAKRAERRFSDFKDLKRRVPKLGDGIINAFREFVAFGENAENQENQLININTASAEILKDLPKIGDVLSTNIVNQRTKQRFESKEDLKKVYGIGPKIYDAVKDLITI